MKSVKKILAVVLAAFMVFTMLPQTVLATDGTITENGTYNLSGYGNDSTISIDAGLTVTLAGDSATLYNNVRIVCGAGVSLTLNNVKINNSAVSGSCALSFTGADNVLTLVGESTLTSGQNQSGVKVESGTELTIDGGETDKLTATGGYNAAGIGGGNNGNGGTTTINGGMVTATGRNNGAGIGGGNLGNGGIVTISGGTVTATGGLFGAGIGGGFGGSGSSNKLGHGGIITISGGTVEAAGSSSGAGIGGGQYSDGGNITISGGTVTASSTQFGAGIGGGGGNFGLVGSGGTITISAGAAVTATGGAYGAGIGGGGIASGSGGIPSGGSGGEITISGGTVNATGGTYGAGIGGAGSSASSGSFVGGSGGEITISDGTVTANGGENGAGIGGGFAVAGGGSGGEIAISGGTVTATGGTDGAGIGGGKSGGTIGNGGSGGTVTITGGTVNATGNGGANIGGGAGATDQGTLKNEGGSDVYLTVIRLLGSDAADAAVESLTTGLTGYTYGLSDVSSSGQGRLYFYLPLGTETTQVVTSTGTFTGRAVTAASPTVFYFAGDGAGGDTYYLSDYGNDSIITIDTGLTVTLAGDVAKTYTNVRIFCSPGVSLTLNNVNINNSAVSDSCALSFSGEDNALTLVGESTLTSGQNQPGVKVESGTELTIEGGDTDKLTVTGGNRGAGIGGGGDVKISGGTVEATGGNSAAGIGGGRTGSGGTITISGGTVTATGGGTGGAGIGAGGYGSANAGTITISGGEVTATGPYGGAGIGSGGYGSGSGGGTITISGGKVMATGGGTEGAGIGGGRAKDGGTITISGGEVTATGGTNGGAGIGGGGGTSSVAPGSGGVIVISSGEVTATGGTYGAGIGGGGRTTGIDGGSGGIVTLSGGVGGTITISGGIPTISGGTVTATGSGGGADIGGGAGASDQGTLIIETAACVAPATNVTFTAAQTGGTGGTTDSTGITLTFSEEVTGLTADKIMIMNGTGSATRGTLSGSGTTWTIALTGVATQGNVFVFVADFGSCNVTTVPQSVAVYRGFTPAERIDADHAALVWNAIKGSNSAENDIKTALNLPKTGEYGATIAWSASPAGIINTNTGIVTRQLDNKAVALTATVTYTGGTEKTKTFNLTVPAIPGRLEAEDAVISSGKVYGDTQAVGASGGKQVGNLGVEGSSSVQWNNLPQSSMVEIRYASPNIGTISIYKNGVHIMDAAFTSTGGWFGEGHFGSLWLPLEINSGDSLKIQYDTGDKVLNLDYIECYANLIEDAVLHPASLTFDKTNPEDMTATVEWNNARAIAGIKAGGVFIGAGNYSVVEDTLTIRKEYLLTKAVGDLALTVVFEKGNSTILTITVTESPAVSVDVIWGSMEFTYADGTWNPEIHEYEGIGWTTGENANKISVTSTSEIPVTVSYTYGQETGYLAVSGGFSDGTNPITSRSLPAGNTVPQSCDVFLILSGKPPEVYRSKIGSITITITD